MFYLVMDSNSNVIFELPDIDLHNRILISNQNSDLKKSASSINKKSLNLHECFLHSGDPPSSEENLGTDGFTVDSKLYGRLQNAN